MIRTPLRRTRLRAGAPPRKRRKTRKGQIPEAVLDALWGKLIRQRDKDCRYRQEFGLRAACAGEIQACHVYSRTYRGTRWDEDGGLGLCAKHHMLMHRNPVYAGRFYEKVLGQKKLDWLWAKTQAAVKVDRAAVRESLRARIAEFEQR